MISKIENTKQRSRKLYDDVLTKFEGCIVMDGETYVKQFPGPKYYIEKQLRYPSLKFKYVLQDKYAKRLMIWQEKNTFYYISDNGLSYVYEGMP